VAMDVIVGIAVGNTHGVDLWPDERDVASGRASILAPAGRRRWHFDAASGAGPAHTVGRRAGT
jgi:hypothetical protein